jgi:hypothetical protein
MVRTKILLDTIVELKSAVIDVHYNQEPMYFFNIYWEEQFVLHNQVVNLLTSQNSIKLRQSAYIMQLSQLWIGIGVEEDLLLSCPFILLISFNYQVNVAIYNFIVQPVLSVMNLGRWI